MSIRFLVTAATLLGAVAGAAVHLDVSHHVDIVVETDEMPASPQAAPCDKHKSGTVAGFKPSSPHITEDHVATLGGYRHRGFDSSDGPYISFSNVPYATPPTSGHHRFSRPEWFYSETDDVNNGTEERICPQGPTGWFPIAADFLNCFGKTNAECDLDSKNWTSKIDGDNYGEFPPKESIIPSDKKQSEDCLLLDVHVPQDVWKNKAKKKVPVLIWIHGGGFVFGYKSQAGGPSGLFKIAEDTKEPFIFIAINYRLGAFGFSAGNTFVRGGGTPNVGLHDQDMAFQWVQEYIEEFGGDPTNVTVMGESAGASSILWHLTSWEGDESEKPAFSRAIMLSPAFFPSVDSAPLDSTFIELAIRAGAYSLSTLRTRDTKSIITANAQINFYSDYGLFRYGPVLEAQWQELPGQLIAKGKYHKGIPVIAGHAFLDGLLFAPPWVRTNDQLESHIQGLYPNFKKDQFPKIKELYPVNDTGTARERLYTVFDLLDDVAVSCNAVYLSEGAVKNNLDNTWRYLLSAPPAPIHGHIPNYVFCGAGSAPCAVPKGVPVPDKALARHIQRRVTTFTADGNPNDGILVQPLWRRYEANSNPTLNRRVLRLGRMPLPTIPGDKGDQIPVEDIDFMNLPGVKNRCQFWQANPFFDEDSDGLVNQSPDNQWEL